MIGPSPRVRGERALHGAGCLDQAGHPRVCGENRSAGSAVRVVRGPSPRVRGERQQGSGAGTPCAGHPRVCGENVANVVVADRELRAIPACAGRTGSWAFMAAWVPGPSPRVRGERLIVGATKHAQTGHPRVCGENVAAPAEVDLLLRAIPACAGRTLAMPWRERITPGPSPRVRGERVCRLAPARPCTGHPRVCGENGQGLPSARDAQPGHPRVCGENAGIAGV